MSDGKQLKRVGGPVIQQLLKTTMEYPSDSEFNPSGDFDKLVCVRSREVPHNESPDRLASARVIETWYLPRKPTKGGQPVVLDEEEVGRALRHVFFAAGSTASLDVVTDRYEVS